MRISIAQCIVNFGEQEILASTSYRKRWYIVDLLCIKQNAGYSTCIGYPPGWFYSTFQSVVQDFVFCRVPLCLTCVGCCPCLCVLHHHNLYSRTFRCQAKFLTYSSLSGVLLFRVKE